jgi:hypothetical protein
MPAVERASIREIMHARYSLSCGEAVVRHSENGAQNAPTSGKVDGGIVGKV